MKKIFFNPTLILAGIISSFNLISCDKKGETSVNEGYKFYVLRQEKLVETMHHSFNKLIFRWKRNPINAIFLYL